jgi:hypothetical protein
MKQFNVRNKFFNGRESLIHCEGDDGVNGELLATTHNYSW